MTYKLGQLSCQVLNFAIFSLINFKRFILIYFYAHVFETIFLALFTVG